jgi:hypothetical protein
MGKKSAKILFFEILLCIGSILLTYFFLECVGFRLALPYLPLKHYGNVPEGIRVLAQSSKRATIPRHYIALVGDSYAQGEGDWLLDSNFNRNPSFHSAHLIYEITGRDVITFGAPGTGSLGGIVTAPIARFKYLNASFLYSMPEPDVFLVYFYAGNDLNNNLEDLRLRFYPKYSEKDVKDPKLFRQFLLDVVLGANRLYVAAQSGLQWRDNLFFLKMLISGISRVQNGTFAYDTPIMGGANKAIVDGKEVVLPDSLQSPGLELSTEEVQLAVFVLEQALLCLKETFPKSLIKVIYVPSPIECYSISSPEVEIQTYENRSSHYSVEALQYGRAEVLTAIQTVALKNGFEFVDATPYLRKASKRAFVHGPKDWKHFNKLGHMALTQAALKVLHWKNTSKQSTEEKSDELMEDELWTVKNSTGENSLR